MKSNNSLIETIGAIVLGGLAIFTIKAIFEDDNSKIVSKKGRLILSDEDEMEAINTQLNETEDHYKDVLVE